MRHLSTKAQHFRHNFQRSTHEKYFIASFSYLKFLHINPHSIIERTYPIFDMIAAALRLIWDVPLKIVSMLAYASLLRSLMASSLKANIYADMKKRNYVLYANIVARRKAPTEQQPILAFNCHCCCCYNVTQLERYRNTSRLECQNVFPPVSFPPCVCSAGESGNEGESSLDTFTKDFNVRKNLGT